MDPGSTSQRKREVVALTPQVRPWRLDSLNLSSLTALPAQRRATRAHGKAKSGGGEPALVRFFVCDRASSPAEAIRANSPMD